MRKLPCVLCVTVWACLFVTKTWAQSTPSAPSSEGWRVQFTPYLWGSGFKERVGIGERTADVDASFSDIFGELNFAFMGALEASRDKFVTFTDLMYLNLSDKNATTGPLFSSVKAIERSFILSSEAGYRIVGSNAAHLDVLAGIRFWRANGELQFEPGLLQTIAIEDSRNWVDGILALKGRTPLSSSWFASGYGDIGGGGSNLTYQVFGAAGANLGDHYAFVFGYRYLNVNYNKEGFLLDTVMQGPVFGFTFKF